MRGITKAKKKLSFFLLYMFCAIAPMMVVNVNEVYCNNNHIQGDVTIDSNTDEDENDPSVYDDMQGPSGYNIKRLFVAPYVVSAFKGLRKIFIAVLFINLVFYYGILQEEQKKELFKKTIIANIVLIIFLSCRMVIGNTLQWIVDMVYTAMNGKI